MEVVARELVVRPNVLPAAILAMSVLLYVLPCLGEPKILSPSPRMFLEQHQQESLLLTQHPVVTQSLLSLSHQNLLGAHL